MIEYRGKILYGKEENTKCKMASTTKIMTAIVVIENAKDLNEIVEISSKSAGTGGSRLGLHKNDKITVKDLLYGLLLCSGNDAAVALSEYVAGSVENFASLMNKKVREMNLTNTNFVTPHGLDEEKHYTTAYELAMITDYALNIKEFVNIVKTKTYTIYINGNAKSISNTNELLGSLEGVYGVKTGFTNGANRCLVTAVKRKNMDIICVVLGADTKKYRGKDSIELIEYTFSNYEMVDIKSKIEEKFNETIKNAKFNINKGISNELKIQLEDNNITLYPVYKDNIKDIEIDININENLEAPIRKNAVIGRLEVKINYEIIYELEILAEENIHKKSVINYYEELLCNMKDWMIKGAQSKNINEIAS